MCSTQETVDTVTLYLCLKARYGKGFSFSASLFNLSSRAESSSSLTRCLTCSEPLSQHLKWSGDTVLRAQTVATKTAIPWSEAYFVDRSANLAIIGFLYSLQAIAESKRRQHCPLILGCAGEATVQGDEKLSDRLRSHLAVLRSHSTSHHTWAL